MRILRDTDPPVQSGGQPGPAENPPPAAKTVLTGTKNEREIELQTELEKEREGKRKLEVKNAELEDQIHTLTAPPVVAPVAEQSFRWRPFKT